jgi:hypothetical protein
MKLQRLLLVAGLLVATILQAQDVGSSKWVSSYHKITITVVPPFEVLSQQIDRKDRVRVLLIDQNDGTSIQLLMDEKHARLLLSDEEYRKTLRDGLSSGRIIDEREVQMFGATWHRIRGELMNKKWNARMIIDIHYRLVEGRLVLIQWAYSCEAPLADSPLPPKIQKVIGQSEIFPEKL